MEDLKQSYNLIIETIQDNSRICADIMGDFIGNPPPAIDKATTEMLTVTERKLQEAARIIERYK